MMFVCLTGVILFVGFSGALVGSQIGFKDWGFHLCYARTLDAAGCSNGLYSGYSSLGNLPAHVFGWLGVPPGLFFSLLVAACLLVVACLLFDYAGFAGFLSFFFIAPIVSVYVLRNPSFLWFSWGLCGNLAWVVAFTLFAWLALRWRDLGVLSRLTGFLLLIFSHNYGWGLAALLFFATVLHGLFHYFLASRNAFLTGCAPFLSRWVFIAVGLFAVALVAGLLGLTAVTARLWSPFLLLVCAEAGYWVYGPSSRE